MRDDIEQRACDIAVYIIENKVTVRAAAKRFGISKSTVHKDMEERLRRLDLPLYEQVRDVMRVNKAERHLRGGAATSAHFRRLREAKRQAHTPR